MSSMGDGKGKEDINAKRTTYFKKKKYMLQYKSDQHKTKSTAYLAKSTNTDAKKKPITIQNQQSWTELTLEGVQRGIERNRTLEKTYSRIILSYFFFFLENCQKAQKKCSLWE